jgi:hypothetical protein
MYFLHILLHHFRACSQPHLVEVQQGEGARALRQGVRKEEEEKYVFSFQKKK